MQSITIAAKIENLDTVLDFINEQLEQNDCSVKAQMQIAVAIEEIFVNIAHYAYPDSVGDAEMEMEIDDGTAVFRFSDGGIPYDPLAKTDPDITLEAEERNIGGLGIFMVKKMMDSIDYEYADGKNILTLKKNIR